MTVRYLDYTSGSDANNGTSWALAKKTTSGMQALVVRGDEVRVAKTADPVSTGINATWTLGSNAITLSASNTQLLDDCETAWTAGTNITSTAPTSGQKAGTACVQLVSSSSFSSGIVGYKALNGGTGYTLSAYQQITFWFKSSVALTAGQIQIRLCSDTAGATPLHTLNIPATGYVSNWQPITINNNSAFSSTVIKSISLYAPSTGQASRTFVIDNVNVTKAPATATTITLHTLLSKNGTAFDNGEGWYAVQSINGTTVNLDSSVNAAPASGKGYISPIDAAGTETVALYTRMPVATAAVAAAATTTLNSFATAVSGTTSITYSGGWNTATGLQDGETWLDGLNGAGLMFGITTSYWSFDRFGVVRAYEGMDIGGTNVIAGTLYVTDLSTYGVYLASPSATPVEFKATKIFGNLTGFHVMYNSYAVTSVVIGAAHAYGVTGDGFYLPAYTTVGDLHAYKCNTGVVCSGNPDTILVQKATIRYNSVAGFTSSLRGLGAQVRNALTSNNAYVVRNSDSGIWKFYNSTFYEGTVITYPTTTDVETWITSDKHGGTAGTFYKWLSGATISSQTTTRHTASGLAWQIAMLSATLRMVNSPVILPVARVLVNANTLVTASIWVNKDDANKIGCTFLCPGGQIAGVDNDVSTRAALSTGWQQLTITFTPTEVGVIELQVQGWMVSGVANIFVDDFAISQA